jgi:hypothetical protein
LKSLNATVPLGFLMPLFFIMAAVGMSLLIPIKLSVHDVGLHRVGVHDVM